MSNNTPRKQPYQPSFITPPPPHFALYGAPSESQVNANNGNNAESQATNVTEVLDEEDLSPTPPLSQYNEAGVAQSATPGVSSLKRTNAPGFRGNRVYTNAQHKYMFRPNLNDPSQDFPSDVHGNRVPFNDPRRNASRHVENVEETIANLSSATPLPRRNVIARAAASSAAEAAESEEFAASSLFSPAAASAASAAPRESRPSALSLTPKRKRQNQNNGNRNGKNEASGGKRRTLRKQHTYRKQRKGTQRKQRKQRKGTQRKHKTRC